MQPLKKLGHPLTSPRSYPSNVSFVQRCHCGVYFCARCLLLFACGLMVCLFVLQVYWNHYICAVSVNRSIELGQSGTTCKQLQYLLRDSVH